MIKKLIACILLLFIFSCSSIEFVLKDTGQTNPLKDKTALLIDKSLEETELYPIYGDKLLEVNHYRKGFYD